MSPANLDARRGILLQAGHVVSFWHVSNHVSLKPDSATPLKKNMLVQSPITKYWEHLLLRGGVFGGDYQSFQGCTPKVEPQKVFPILDTVKIRLVNSGQRSASSSLIFIDY